MQEYIDVTFDAVEYRNSMLIGCIADAVLGCGSLSQVAQLGDSPEERLKHMLRFGGSETAQQHLVALGELSAYARALRRAVLTWRVVFSAYALAMRCPLLSYCVVLPATMQCPVPS
eukprot:1861091-Rhodomonas_salina.3